MPQYDQRAAIDALFTEFPQVREDVDSSMAGLFYPEMGCFARYVQRQIDAGNRAELGRCYEWLDLMANDRCRGGRIRYETT